MVESGKAPRVLVEEKGLVQISDSSELESVARAIIADNPGPAADFRAGKEKALGFLVGQMMKATKGKANPKMANEIIRSELAKIE
jgi:aspartyl-tRNA(Asn)/glutamyl-tRNA(Gln) amidotransferase subunit B